MSYFHRLKGALKSKKKAAYLGLFLYAASIFTRLIDTLVYSFRSKTTLKNKPLLIILSCPPTSGSTVLFQNLTRELIVNYPSNLHFLFPKMGRHFFKRLKTNPANWATFNNYYGYTPSLCDVNEGNYFFNTLERYNDREMALAIESFVSNMSCNGQAVICKTVSSYSFLSKIHKAYSNTLFIRITREISQNIQSELAAYYELKSFNPIPPSLSGIDFNIEPAKFAVSQISEMNNILDREFAIIPKSQTLSVSYEAFCENPNHYIDFIVSSCKNLNGTSIKKRGYSTHLKASDRLKVGQKDVDIIEMEINKNA